MLTWNRQEVINNEDESQPAAKINTKKRALEIIGEALNWQCDFAKSNECGGLIV